jgi:hypothetical protein
MGVCTTRIANRAGSEKDDFRADSNLGVKVNFHSKPILVARREAKSSLGARGFVCTLDRG